MNSHGPSPAGRDKKNRNAVGGADARDDAGDSGNKRIGLRGNPPEAVPAIDDERRQIFWNTLHDATVHLPLQQDHRRGGGGEPVTEATDKSFDGAPAFGNEGVGI